MITLPISAVGEIPSHETVMSAVRAFDAGSSRLNKLARYYDGRHDILGRARLSGLPNNRIVHAFPRYISQVSASYLLGEPVNVEGPEPGAEALRALLKTAAADSIDVDLAIAQSVFGRAVSLCYEDNTAKPFVCSLDPRSAFVVYADTVDHAPLFGAYLEGNGAARRVTVYTSDRIITYPQKGSGGSVAVLPHPFLAIPMVEYLNASDAHGDFEDVLSLVDAYDLLACDRLNDRQQFSDAILVLTGVMGIGPDPGDSVSALERLRQEKTLALPDADAKAEWLMKNPVERDLDVLRGTLVEDIHKFSLTPDFSDERFAGNASGIAIKYKLFNFDNRVKLKERFFITGLRERARAFCGWLKTRRGVTLDADELTFRLARRLPMNEAERAQTLQALKEILPKETLVQNSPIQSDP